MYEYTVVLSILKCTVSSVTHWYHSILWHLGQMLTTTLPIRSSVVSASPNPFHLVEIDPASEMSWIYLCIFRQWTKFTNGIKCDIILSEPYSTDAYVLLPSLFNFLCKTNSILSFSLLSSSAIDRFYHSCQHFIMNTQHKKYVES
jgi:hypothetical protein